MDVLGQGRHPGGEQRRVDLQLALRRPAADQGARVDVDVVEASIAKAWCGFRVRFFLGGAGARGGSGQRRPSLAAKLVPW